MSTVTAYSCGILVWFRFFYKLSTDFLKGTIVWISGNRSIIIAHEEHM